LWKTELKNVHIFHIHKVDRKNHGLKTSLRSKALKKEKEKENDKMKYRCSILKTNFFSICAAKSIQTPIF